MWGVAGKCGIWGIPLVSDSLALSLGWKDGDDVAALTTLGCCSQPPPCWIRCMCSAPEIRTIRSRREKSMLLKESERIYLPSPTIKIGFS
jgi:hypothetical protein